MYSTQMPKNYGKCGRSKVVTENVTFVKCWSNRRKCSSEKRNQQKDIKLPLRLLDL